MNNLIFHNLAEVPGESEEDIENSVRSVITESMNITVDIGISSVRRISSKSAARTRPVLVTLTDLKHKGIILKSTGKLRGESVNISQDFSVKTRETRPENTAREEGKLRRTPTR